MQPEVAEQALLGACFLNQKAALIAAESVGPSDFYLPKHQLIFERIMAIIQSGAAVDPVSVASAMNGEANYVFSLPSLCPYAAHIREYAALVRDASLDRQLRKTVGEAAETLRGQELLLALQEGLYGLDRKEKDSVSMEDVWQRIKTARPAETGCEYPWSKIQFFTRGLRQGWLCILAGETSMGKTAAALQIAEHAIRAGKRVVIVSQEMGAEDIGLRIAQRRGLDADRFYAGRMSADDLAVLESLEAGAHWKNLRIETVESAAEIGVVLRRWKPDILVLDHLQLLAGSEKVEELSRTTRTLKVMAERFKTPILCLSQMSRGEVQEHASCPACPASEARARSNRTRTRWRSYGASATRTKCSPRSQPSSWPSPAWAVSAP